MSSFAYSGILPLTPNQITCGNDVWKGGLEQRFLYFSFLLAMLQGVEGWNRKLIQP